MKCPACGHAMTTTTVQDVQVDVCEGGCGGIWFDWFELKKVDEQHEAVGENLLYVERDPHATVDHDHKRDCPRCDGIVMTRHFASVKRVRAFAHMFRFLLPSYWIPGKQKWGAY